MIVRESEKDNQSYAKIILPPDLEAYETSNSTIVVYEFKIDGMTCVNCSNAIENGLKHAFKDKGLLENNFQQCPCFFFQFTSNPPLIGRSDRYKVAIVTPKQIVHYSL